MNNFTVQKNHFPGWLVYGPLPAKLALTEARFHQRSVPSCHVTNYNVPLSTVFPLNTKIFSLLKLSVFMCLSWMSPDCLSPLTFIWDFSWCCAMCFDNYIKVGSSSWHSLHTWISWVVLKCFPNVASLLDVYSHTVHLKILLPFSLCFTSHFVSFAGRLIFLSFLDNFYSILTFFSGRFFFTFISFSSPLQAQILSQPPLHLSFALICTISSSKQSTLHASAWVTFSICFHFSTMLL